MGKAGELGRPHRGARPGLLAGQPATSDAIPLHAGGRWRGPGGGPPGRPGGYPAAGGGRWGGGGGPTGGRSPRGRPCAGGFYSPPPPGRPPGGPPGAGAPGRAGPPQASAAPFTPPGVPYA